MNIFFYQDQKNHSSLMGDLAWCSHNERIHQLEECKELMKKIIHDEHANERLKKVSKRAIRYYDRLIKVCHKYKHQRAVDDKWLNNYLKEERGNNG